MDEAPLSKCIEWWHKFTRDGYGVMSRKDPWTGRKLSAHRMAWIECFGEIPEGMSVLHRCDNKRCVNPEHLFLGTQRDNIRDAMAKGRMPQFYRDMSGAKNPNAKMSQEDMDRVVDLLNRGEQPPTLARMFGVTRERIYQIRGSRSV